MRIQEVSVSKLFGIFDHRIKLHLEDHITIIHGPNGLGKTVILRMLAGLLGGQLSVFRRVPFERFRVDFDSGEALEVHVDHVATSSEKDVPSTLPRVVLTPYRLGQKGEPYSPEERKSALPVHMLVERIEAWVPYLTRCGAREWVHDHTGEVLDLEDVLERFPDEIPVAPENEKPEPVEVRRLRTSMNVVLIRTQRLDAAAPVKFRGRRSPLRLSVERNSEALSSHIRATLETYAAVSQKLDRDFPLRVFRQESAPSLPASELRQKLAALEERRAKLKNLGFLDLDHQLAQVPDKVIEEQRGIFSIYVNDVEQKLAVFDDLARRIELFTEIINARFLYKTLNISRESGYVFLSSAGAQLKPADLSSGEQHELVLFHELMFGVSAGSLILIDEPEISLHIVWQQNFLPDLRKIVGISNLDAIIATHSPEIIGDSWNLTVELKGPMALAK